MFNLLFLVIIASAIALPTPDEANTVDKVQVIKKDCASGVLNLSCLKHGAIAMLETLNNKDEVALIPGVSLVKEKGKSNYEEVVTDLARSLSSDQENKVDKSLLHHLGSFLDTHSIKLSLLDDNAVEEAKTAIEKGRSKRKKGGMGGLIAIAAMMKAATVTLSGFRVVFQLR